VSVDVGRGIVATAQIDGAAGIDQVNVIAKVLHRFRTVDTQRYLNTSDHKPASKISK